MHLGSAWYPEHWPESRWATDLELMAKAGMTVVRVAEFAWSRLEPAEGRFELDWLARAVDLAARYGLKTVIGTPTATPPAWLTRAHPEILPTRDSGRIQGHGERGHINPAHPTYLAYCHKIADALGRRFGRHPQVIGWQIDNEYWSISRDEVSRRHFQDYLRQRHGDLATLNARWSTTYWSQEYFDWSELHFPASYPNPGLILAFYEWASAVTRAYQRVQVDAIRAHAEPRQFITHNFHPFDEFDRWEITRDLTFPSWDAYPADGVMDPYRTGLNADRIRGLAGGTIWIMETQPGFVNWQAVSACLERGQARAFAWQLAGHGADAVLYWQWRSAPNNQEQYHGAIIGQDGGPRPLYDELAVVGREFARLSPLLDGTVPAASVAVLDAWRDRRSLRFQRHHKDYEPILHTLESYRALRQLGHGVNVLDRVERLENCRLLVAPRLNLLDDASAARLAAFVRGGGHLVLGARSGMKDEFSALRPQRQPGPLADLLGAGVREFYALPTEIPVGGSMGSGQARWFAEWLEPSAADTEVLLRYGPGHSWLAGQPALVTRRAGQGRISYLGACVDEGLSRQVMAWAAGQAKVAPLLANVPPGVIVSRRTGAGRDVLIVVNHGSATVDLPLPGPMTEHLAGQGPVRQVRLEPLGVAVLS